MTENHGADDSVPSRAMPVLRQPALTVGHRGI
jgi:hypothetical protein